MDEVIQDKRLIQTFWTMDEFVKAAERDVLASTRDYVASRPNFHGTGSFATAVEMGRNGWAEQLPETLEIAESAITMAEQEHMMDTFLPVWDVTGAEVDVARYLSGEPECMIDFPLTQTSKQGRVITLVVGSAISAAISTDTYIRRGRGIVALALALARLGHAIEIWSADHSKGGGREIYSRVLVKSAHDEIDPSRLMFALAHPAMQRALCWAVRDGFPEPWRSYVSIEASRGIPVHTADDKVKALYPEGSIFLPGVRSGTDIPGIEVFLKTQLSALGLLADE